jgi:hypothetical protein
LLAAACGDHRAAAPDAPPSNPREGVILSRGVAGAETLYFRSDDGTELQLSTGEGSALCDGKTYCDYPPGVSATRFPAYDVVGNVAVFLDAATVATQSSIFSVDLTTGERTVISHGVSWAPLTETRPGWVYSMVRAGHATFWSIATIHGVELFRGDDAGSPLVSIAQRSLPAGQTAIQTWLQATDSAVAWSIETTTFDRIDLLLDHAGTVRWSSDELPSGAVHCTTAKLAGHTYAIGFSLQPHCPNETTWLFDTTTLAKLELTKPAASMPLTLSADGERLAEFSEDPTTRVDTTWVFDTHTGGVLGSAPGIAAEFALSSHDLLVTRGVGVSQQLGIFDVAAQSVQTRTGANFGDGGLPGQHDMFFTADGAGVVTLVGDASPDMCANIGLRVLWRAGGELDLAPPTCDPTSLRLPASGTTPGTLLYLDQGNLVEAELTTGAVRQISASVRAFAVVQSPPPDQN